KIGGTSWEERNLKRPYRVRMDWKDWSAAKCTYVSREIEIARLEYMAAKKKGDKDEGLAVLHWKAGPDRSDALSC
ncbi:hypothetical protein, partial [Xanthomonas fragariae]